MFILYIIKNIYTNYPKYIVVGKDYYSKISDKSIFYYIITFHFYLEKNLPFYIVSLNLINVIPEDLNISKQKRMYT